MGSRLLLPDSGIYIAFIKNAVVKGDEVEYTTNFGVKLVSSGNSRTLGSFLGFRRANPDGTVEFLDENWKVSGRGVCFTRKEIKTGVKEKSVSKVSMEPDEKRKKAQELIRQVREGSVK